MKRLKFRKEKGMYIVNYDGRDRLPGTGMLTVSQVAEWLNVERRTVTALIERYKNPLPAVDIGAGGKNRAYRVSVEALARFSS